MEDLFGMIGAHVVTNAWRLIIEVACDTLIFVLWTYRNVQVFENKKYKEFMFDSIISFLFNWFSIKNCKVRKTFTLWMQNPLMN